MFQDSVVTLITKSNKDSNNTTKSLAVKVHAA